jgi:heme/copper-type cytochrome/quinol oxidase subunit 2
MTARVRAVSPEEFRQWIAQRKADIKAADEAAARQRQQIQGSSGSTTTGATP